MTGNEKKGKQNLEFAESPLLHLRSLSSLCRTQLLPNLHHGGCLGPSPCARKSWRSGKRISLPAGSTSRHCRQRAIAPIVIRDQCTADLDQYYVSDRRPKVRVQEKSIPGRMCRIKLVIRPGHVIECAYVVRGWADDTRWGGGLSIRAGGEECEGDGEDDNDGLHIDGGRG